MHAQQQQAEPTVDTIPDELETPLAKLVYLYLDVDGGGTPSELQETLGLKKITLFSVLDALERRELVEQRDDTYTVRA